MKFPAWRPRLAHLLTAGAVLCATLAGWPWLEPAATPRAAAKPAPAEPIAKIPELPPLASFPAINERPLFSPSRRPVAVKPSAPAPSGEMRYRLVGVLIVGERRRAMLMDGSRSFEIGEGEKLDSWTVQRIESGRLILSSPGGETELKLRQAANDNAGAAAAPKPKP